MNKQILKHVIRYILIVFIIILCVKIFKLSGENGTQSKDSSNSFSKKIAVLLNKEFDEKQFEEFDHIIRKTAHFLLYALLGALSIGCMETFDAKAYKKLIYSGSFSFLYACSDEFHQKLVPGRSGEIRDILIDTFGALIGILFIFVIVLIIRVIVKRVKEKNQKLLDSKTSSKSKKRNILFIASTGGHLSELMQLKPIFNNYKYHVITEKTEVDESLKEEFGNKMRFLIYGTKKHLFRYIIKFTFNCFISLYYYFRFQPEIVITTGTHTAVPMCYIAKLFGSKVIFIETFANRTTATMAGKLVYPIADVFVVQWDEMHEIYPKSVCWGWIY